MIVPDAQRTIFVDALRSKHKTGLPAQLETGRVYRPVNPAAEGHRAELRILIGHDGTAFYLDYFTTSEEASSHRRIAADGSITALENYEGQFGIKTFPDPADTARERARVADHNRQVAAVLKQKGFED